MKLDIKVRRCGFYQYVIGEVNYATKTKKEGQEKRVEGYGGVVIRGQRSATSQAAGSARRDEGVKG